MNDKDKRCALCGTMPETEEPAILALGRYGVPRYLCEQCEREIDAATLSKDHSEAVAAIESLGKKMASFGKDDLITVDTVRKILEKSAQRAAAIKDGSYDFALDEAEEGDEEGFDEIPEELLESEEDKALDAKEAATSKKMDKILNWVSGIVFAAAAVFFILRMFGVI